MTRFRTYTGKLQCTSPDANDRKKITFLQKEFFEHLFFGAVFVVEIKNLDISK